MDITIRDAKPGDAPAIVSLIREMAHEDGESTPITETCAAQYFDAPGSAMLIAEANGQAAGLLSYSLRPNLYHAAPACLVELLFIRGDARSQGAGGALVTALLARAAARRWTEISVSVMPDNAGAIRFYRKLGLTEEAVFLEKHFHS